MDTSSAGVRKGAWTPEEDVLLKKCVEKYGEGRWHLVPLRAGLKRCRKSCRLRWLNYLKPDIKRGQLTPDEVDLIIRLHKLLGNRWSLISGRLPGRTANDIKNYWNTRIVKKLVPQPEEVLKATVYKVAGKEKFEVINRVIKPQPRTFSKNSWWLRRGNTSVADTTHSGDMLNISSTKFSMESSDDMKWLEDMLIDAGEDKGTCNSSYLGGGSKDEFIESLWVENREIMTKVGEILMEGEDKSDWVDLCFDGNMWDLIGMEQEKLM